MYKHLIVFFALTGSLCAQGLNSGHVGSSGINIPLEINFNKEKDGTPCTGAFSALGSSGGYNFYDFTASGQYCYFYTLLLCPSGNSCINANGSFNKTYLSKPTHPYRAYIANGVRDRSINFNIGDSTDPVKDRNEIVVYRGIESARNYSVEFDLKLKDSDTFPSSDEWFMLMQVRQNGTIIASPPLSIDLKNVGGERHLQIAGRSRPQLWDGYGGTGTALAGCSVGQYVYPTGGSGDQCEDISQSRVVYYDLNLDSSDFVFDSWNKIKLHFRLGSNGNGWVRLYIDNNDNGVDNFVLVGDPTVINGHTGNFFMGDSTVMPDEEFTMKFGIYRGAGTADVNGVFREDFNVGIDEIKLSGWGW